MCEQHKRLASSRLTMDSRAIATQMFRAPLESFTERQETAESAAGETLVRAVSASQYGDLRKFLMQIIERHIEKKLITASMLAKL
jgi:DNA repair protein RecO (recombination protein O)